MFFSTIRENLNHIEVDLKKFNTMENLSKNSFTSCCYFSKESNNKLNISNKTSKSNVLLNY